MEVIFTFLLYVFILPQVFESVFMKLYFFKVIFSLMKDLIYALGKEVNLDIQYIF